MRSVFAFMAYGTPPLSPGNSPGRPTSRPGRWPVRRADRRRVDEDREQSHAADERRDDLELGPRGRSLRFAVAGEPSPTDPLPRGDVRWRAVPLGDRPRLLRVGKTDSFARAKRLPTRRVSLPLPLAPREGRGGEAGGEGRASSWPAAGRCRSRWPAEPQPSDQVLD